MPRVGVIKCLADGRTKIIKLPSIAEEKVPLVPGSVITNARMDYVLLGYGCKSVYSFSFHLDFMPL